MKPRQITNIAVFLRWFVAGEATQIAVVCAILCIKFSPGFTAEYLLGNLQNFIYAAAPPQLWQASPPSGETNEERDDVVLSTIDARNA